MYRKIKAYAEAGTGWIWDIGMSIGVTTLVARFFYKSWFAFILIVPIGYIFRKHNKEKRKEAEKKQLLKEFKNGMEMVSANLMAGYALENAFVETQKELAVLYGKDSRMCRELEKINQKVSMNQPLEKVFAEFALASGIEEIENFSEVLSFAKRSGGDFVEMIKGTVINISEKLRVEEEIECVTAEKKLEQKVMNVMPMFLLFYLNMMSPGYLDILYRNLSGVLVMSCCLIVYAAAILLSERIVHIEV